MNSASKSYEPAFRGLYQHLGLLSSPLHIGCHNAKACWQSVAHRPSPPNNEIYMPWVGDLYNKTRLLVLGFNMNNAGGWDILHRDDVGVPAARRELLVRRKIRLGAAYSAYRGTLFDNYMLPCAWAALLKIASRYVPRETLETIAKAARSVSDTNRQALTDMYDYLAFTQLVKCGLKSEWGSPTPTMSNRCPSHVLAGELDILEPRLILGFGAAARGSVNPLVSDPDRRTTCRPQTAYLRHPTWPRFNLDAALKSLWNQI